MSLLAHTPPPSQRGDDIDLNKEHYHHKEHLAR